MYHYSIDMDTDNSLSLILRQIKPNSKVFEFGPADGYMTAYLKDVLKCEVFCVEIDENAAKKAEQYADKMIVADLNKFNWLEEVAEHFGTFDYLIYADVLEHLYNPSAVLEAASSKLLNEQGSVITSIPHIGHSAVIIELLEGNFVYRKNGLLDNTHLRFFTRKSVEKLHLDSGLVPIENHSVYMLPEHTELQKNYGELPSNIAEYIKNRNDAHVYQFITTSKKNTQVNEYLVDEVQSVECYRLAEHVQLFWDNGKGFSEQESIRLPLAEMEIYNNYKFEFNSQERLRTLRLDVTNFACFVEVRSIKIYGLNPTEDKMLLLENLLPNGMDKLSVIHGAELSFENNHALIFSYSEDPQVVIDLSHVNLADIKLYRVEVELQYSKSLNIHLLNQFWNKLNRLELLDFHKQSLSVIEGDIRSKLTGDLEKIQDIFVDIQQSNEKMQELYGKTSTELLFLQEENEKERAKESAKDEIYLQILKEHQNDQALIKDMREEISKLRSSLSWRMTKPLRGIGSFFRKK